MIPNYVIQALAELQEDGSIDMQDRDSVTALIGSSRAAEWLEKASSSQFKEALVEVGRAESETFLEDEEDDSEDDDEEFQPYDV